MSDSRKASKNAKKPALGIVIPIYNGRKEEALELLTSIDLQDTEACRVIWVDDGSSDKSALDALRLKTASSPPIHTFIELKKNGGVAHAMNEGIRACPLETEFVVTMGSDDVFLPGYFSRIQTEFANSPEVEVLVPRAELFGEQSGSLDPQDENFRISRLWKNNTVPAASAFRLKLWERLGGFDETLKGNFEDWDFWFRARLARARFKKIEMAAYRYRVRGGSYSQGIRFEAARQKLHRKWLWPLGCFFARRFITGN